MCIDFRRNPPTTASTLINGTALDVVSQYKYLGTILVDKLNFDVRLVSQYKYLGTILVDKLNFDTNTDYICKKANQRLFFFKGLIWSFFRKFCSGL